MASKVDKVKLAIELEKEEKKLADRFDKYMKKRLLLHEPSEEEAIVELPFPELTEQEREQGRKALEGPKSIRPIRVDEFRLQPMLPHGRQIQNRREKQVNAVRSRLAVGGAFVLATSSFAVYQAKSLLGLVWVYLKHKFWGRKRA